MAIFLFPVLLPITEVNPLFRLVGLLPIYHVLAISLLSVEQMSNGCCMRYGAIPAALLFWELVQVSLAVYLQSIKFINHSHRAANSRFCAK